MRFNEHELIHLAIKCKPTLEAVFWHRPPQGKIRQEGFRERLVRIKCNFLFYIRTNEHGHCLEPLGALCLERCIIHKEPRSEKGYVFSITFPGDTDKKHYLACSSAQQCEHWMTELKTANCERLLATFNILQTKIARLKKINSMNIMQCSFADKDPDHPCGLTPKYPNDTTIVPLAACKRDMTNHLHQLGLVMFKKAGKSSNLVSESDLILNRYGMFNVEEETARTLTVCPVHRLHATLEWPGRGRDYCVYPLHKLKQRKAGKKNIRRINQQFSEEIYAIHSIVVPIGSGICGSCRLDHYKLKPITPTEPTDEEGSDDDTQSTGETHTQEYHEPIGRSPKLSRRSQLLQDSDKQQTQYQQHLQPDSNPLVPAQQQRIPNTASSRQLTPAATTEPTTQSSGKDELLIDFS